MSIRMENIDRRPLYLQVADQIVDLIKAEGMEPGDELPSEHALSDMAGVSRPVVRGALSHLAGAGLIKIANGKRARVGELDPDVLASSFAYGLATSQITIAKILEVRQGVEVAAARFAAERRTEADIRKLERLCADMEAAISDVDRFVDLDFAFHLAIAEATDNALYVYIVQPLRLTIKDSIAVGRLRQSSRADLERIQDCHRAIQKAIADGDSDAAARAMTRHFEIAARAIDDGGRD